MSETLDVLDATGQVIGKAARDVIYAQKLPHRICHVFIINPDTQEVFLQRRSTNVPYRPGALCTSAGGHVRSGETFLQAAKRELQQELNLVVELQPIGILTYEADGHVRFIEVFVGYSKQVLNPANREVEGGIYLTVEEAMRRSNSHTNIHPQLLPCLMLLSQYLRSP